MADRPIKPGQEHCEPDLGSGSQVFYAVARDPWWKRLLRRSMPGPGTGAAPE